jgi:hypothetical protein
MESVKTRNCKQCNQYKYIKASGLCRGCYPINNLTIFTETIKGEFEQGISDVHKFEEHIQKQYETDSDSVNAVRIEDYSAVFISSDCKLCKFKKDGVFVLSNTLQGEQRDNHIKKAMEMYESYHESVENNNDLSISTQPKILHAVYNAELSSFDSKQFRAIADKYTNSSFYPSDKIAKLEHRGVIIFENGHLKIPGMKNREEATELALEVYEDIKNT